MNRALSLLLVFLLLHAQAWAVSGEPVYQVNNLSYSGTYAGVVIPLAGETVQYSTGTNLDGTTSTTSTTSTSGGGSGVPGSGTTTGGTTSSTSTTATTTATDGLLSLTEEEQAQLGVFSFAKPQGSGFAQGVLAMFVGGTIFVGSIEGLINPKNGRLTGFVTAASAITVDSAENYTAGFGTIRARVKNYSESGLTAATATTTTTSTGSRVAARVVGTMTLRLYDPSGAGNQRNFGLKYGVEGWQQSFGTAVPTLTDIF